MLCKLASRNAKRSIRDYAVYLITVTLSFSLIFAFQLISNSKQVLELSRVMQNFKFVMNFTSIFILFNPALSFNSFIKFPIIELFLESIGFAIKLFKKSSFKESHPLIILEVNI